ncbi:MAG: hypothetical protein QXS54_01375 [Candidatus Methanomethylicaceae archaeon]
MYLVKRPVMMVLSLAFVLVTLLEGCRYAPMPTKSPMGTSNHSQILVSPLPTPSSVNAATIRGRLVRDLAGHSEPIASTKILLASVIRSENGTPIVAVASEKTSLMAITDMSGVFIFTDVPIGMYSIVVVTPIGSFMIKDEKTGNDLLFAAQPGMVLDLGEIHTSLPY